MYNLIIVDDETWILSGLQKVIDWNSLGFEVTGCFDNGQSALDYVLSHQVDAILSDIRMPQKDGLTFITEIRKAGYSNIEIVFMSGFGDFSYAQKAISLGACEFILKPSSPDTIKTAFVKVRTKLDQMKVQAPHEAGTMDLKGADRKTLLCRSVSDYISNNISTPMTVQTIAEAFSLTPNYLGNLFFSVTGEKLKDYVNKQKIERAIDLINTGKYKIYEVAPKVGFSNYDYFRKKLKQYGIASDNRGKET